MCKYNSIRITGVLDPNPLPGEVGPLWYNLCGQTAYDDTKEGAFDAISKMEFTCELD